MKVSVEMSLSSLGGWAGKDALRSIMALYDRAVGKRQEVQQYLDRCMRAHTTAMREDKQKQSETKGRPLWEGACRLLPSDSL
jgi:hypothetical protein